MLKRWRRGLGWTPYQPGEDDTQENAPTPEAEETVKPELDANLSSLRKMFGESIDLVVRPLLLASKDEVRLSVVYIDGMVDKNFVSDFAVKSLALEAALAGDLDQIGQHELFRRIKQRALTVAEVHEKEKWGDLTKALLSGNSLLFVDGVAVAMVLGTQGFEHRGVEEPATESAVRGPREGFNEVLRTNTALIRRRLKTPDLRVEAISLGERTRTDIAIMYVHNLASQDLVEEVRNRLKRIDIDGILESGYIEELIEDAPRSLFPTVNKTERPDKVVAQLLEGRVAIVTDGTPFVLTVPLFYWEFLTSPEDYYDRPYIGSFLRIIRLVAFFLALTLPALYIAATTFHQEMIPTPLALSIAAGREAVPFPAVVEALLMEISFEVLREAGVRLPRPVGQAISIVGVLVVGEAAVNAGVVSPIMIIIVGATAVASFTIPQFSASIALRLLRFILMILGATMGFFGIVVGLMTLLTHVAALRSFGVPYLSPLAPMSLTGMKDVVVRAPWYKLVTRPRLITRRPSRRAAPGQEPHPPSTEGSR